MSPDEEGLARFEGEHGHFVSAVIATSLEEAEEYAELLRDHDIPARIGDADAESPSNGAAQRGKRGMTRGVPVLVPEVLLDEASEIIADREDLDEFRVEEEELEEDNDEDFDLDERLPEDLHESPGHKEDFFFDEDEEDDEDLEDEEDDEDVENDDEI